MRNKAEDGRGMTPAGSAAVVLAGAVTLAGTVAAAAGGIAVVLAGVGTAARMTGAGAGAVTSAAGWVNSCPADAGLAD